MFSLVVIHPLCVHISIYLAIYLSISLLDAHLHLRFPIVVF